VKKDNKPVLNHMFVSGIRELIIIARSAVAHHVNTIQVLASFEIGFRIVEQEQKGAKRAAYGQQLILELSAHLLREFGKGFSERNLRNMRKFYLTYQQRYQEIRQKPSAESQAESSDMIWQKSSAKFDTGLDCPTGGRSMSDMLSKGWVTIKFTQSGIAAFELVG